MAGQSLEIHLNGGRQENVDHVFRQSGFASGSAPPPKPPHGSDQSSVRRNPTANSASCPGVHGDGDTAATHADFQRLFHRYGVQPFHPQLIGFAAPELHGPGRFCTDRGEERDGARSIWHIRSITVKPRKGNRWESDSALLRNGSSWANPASHLWNQGRSIASYSCSYSCSCS